MGIYGREETEVRRDLRVRLPGMLGNFSPAGLHLVDTRFALGTASLFWFANQNMLRRSSPDEKRADAFL